MKYLFLAFAFYSYSALAGEVRKSYVVCAFSQIGGDFAANMLNAKLDRDTIMIQAHDEQGRPANGRTDTYIALRGPFSVSAPSVTFIPNGVGIPSNGFLACATVTGLVSE